MIQAKIIKDSINPDQVRLTTMLVTLPKYLVGEFNTHRVFSRNSASSRAIPFEKMVQSVEENPFIPMAWQKHHKGMQGKEYITSPSEIQRCRDKWLESRDSAVKQAKHLYELGVTKQVCNRLLEPFMYSTIIVTSSDFEGFFDVRCPKYVNNELPMYSFRSKKTMMVNADSFGLVSRSLLKEFSELDWLLVNKGQADIHLMKAAEAMYDSLQASTPDFLQWGEWHIPYEELIRESVGYLELSTRGVVDCSISQCARTSYTTIGKGVKIDVDKDLELARKLAIEKHWSPSEHQAMAYKFGERYGGNLGNGWAQARHYLKF